MPDRPRCPDSRCGKPLARARDKDDPALCWIEFNDSAHEHLPTWESEATRLTTLIAEFTEDFEAMGYVTCPDCGENIDDGEPHADDCLFRPLVEEGKRGR
jgi:hypothetical protein